MYYKTISIGGVLIHHGVSGQKWGVRNGPPYPLSDVAHSKSEKKAGWKASLNSNTKINKSVNKLKNKQIADTNEQRSLALAFATLAAPYVSLALITGGAAIAQSITDKKIDKEIKKDKERKENEKTDKKTGLKLKSEEVSEKEDISAVNRYFKHSDGGENAQNNCVYCSLTYEMRKRGYDVAANPRAAGMNGREITSKMFNNTKVNMIDTNGIVKKYNNKTHEIDLNYTTFEERNKIKKLQEKATYNRNKDYARAVINNIQKEENSRGSLFVQWGVGGGHAMSYKVENGVFTIIDPQANKMYSGKDAEKLLSSTWLASSMRLDKSSLNYKNKKLFKEVMS